ncbi:hypothetical protein PLICRDRAFT_33651 [Plicaturopsis crispa FD-325 SS-3]|nr:hypothetical protein PLICRDRAFT_33651 [Plicaturopsis crispa FD-325 SS-3]
MTWTGVSCISQPVFVVKTKNAHKDALQVQARKEPEEVSGPRDSTVLRKAFDNYRQWNKISD